MYKNNFSALAIKLGYEEEVLNYIIKNVTGYYKPFHLTTEKNGKKKTRHIDNPGKKSALKVLQKTINKKLLLPEIGILSPQLVGGIKKKNLFAHILPHVNQPTVVCIDLKNCFPNISQVRLFNVWRDQLGYSTELSKTLNKLTSFRGYLPQGPPTSPLLCNFALSNMSSELTEICAANKLSYTQYVDDVCISGDDNVVRAIIGEVHKIINSYSQQVNDSKTNIMDRKHQQRSARIILNRKPKLLESYSTKLIEEIRAFELHGLINTGDKLHIAGQILYLKKFSADKANRINSIFNQTLLNISEVDANRPKDGKVKTCYHHMKNRYNNSRCGYL